MKKSEAEPVIKQLIDVFLKERGFPFENQNEPTSGAFLTWMQNNHSSYLRFRSSISVEYDVEMWFDQAIREWRRYWNSVQPPQRTRES